MSEPNPDPLEPLVQRWLQSDDPDGVFAQLCRDHPEHATALRTRLAYATPSPEPTSRPADEDLEAPERIGPYKLLDLLGEGGMGTVYLAEQQEPVKRRVALKLIKLGMDSRSVVQRFEHERQALALMDHEGIAKVFDCGTSERGQPYFVMELVRGTTLDVYCARKRLPLRDRLQLIQRVCAAVQHAHQKGVVHRDLKPSNVLVSDLDGGLQVKVIDFGMAKAIGGNLSQGSLFTQFGVVLGTPEFMAPEQADPDNADVDTRADVYSIGVMLYHLLVGQLPFSSEELRGCGLTEMQRKLREVDPPRPSTRLSTDSKRAAMIAEQQRASVAALRKALAKDLDWVVGKALEKDRSRRYDSVHDLAEDLQRYLDHEPLLAGPPTLVYRMQKFVRRNRAAVTAAALVVAALLAGGVTTYVQWGRAERQAAQNLELAQANEQIALEKSALAERNAALATTERESREAAEAALTARNEALAREQERAAELEQVVQFQRGQFLRLDPRSMGAMLRDMLREQLEARLQLQGVDAAEARAALAAHDARMESVNFTQFARGALDASFFEPGLQIIEDQLDDQPVVQARLRQTLASVLEALGWPLRAIEVQERAVATMRAQLGDAHVDTLTSIHRLGALQSAQANYAEAERLLREVWTGLETALGEDHPDTITSQTTLATAAARLGRAEDAEALFQDALLRSERVHGADSEPTAAVAGNLAVLYWDQGRLDEAEPLFRKTLAVLEKERGASHPDTLITMGNIASLLMSQERFEEAAALVTEALGLQRRALGDNHPNTLHSMLRLGALLQAQQKHAEAEPLLRESLRGQRAVLGDAHPRTLTALQSTARCLQDLDREAAAVKLLEDFLETTDLPQDHEHAQTLRETIARMRGQ